MSKLGSRIRAARKDLGLTSEQLAYRSDVSCNTVRGIEKGLFGSMATIEPILEYLESQSTPVIVTEDHVDLSGLNPEGKALIRSMVVYLRSKE